MHSLTDFPDVLFVHTIFLFVIHLWHLLSFSVLVEITYLKTVLSFSLR